MEFRTIKRQLGTEWEVVEMRDVKAGDVVRIYEPDGTLACLEFEATSDAHVIEGGGPHGEDVWGVYSDSDG